MLRWACAFVVLASLGTAWSAALGEPACDPDEGLQARLVRHEGIRLCVYEDQFGNPTIGVGHLLHRPAPEGLCWPEDKVFAVFQHDVERAESGARHDLDADGIWSRLRRGPREVLIEMSFQLGSSGLWRFSRMLSAVRWGDFDRAADEMLNSRWAEQTPRRAQELACLMRKGSE